MWATALQIPPVVVVVAVSSGFSLILLCQNYLLCTAYYFQLVRVIIEWHTGTTTSRKMELKLNDGMHGTAGIEAQDQLVIHL